ncbi:MAG: hypothetical protein K940chlam8_00717 [Chlamydiae bacterium]|nr:hypothetical protein [Chlamydiota bacterium]
MKKLVFILSFFLIFTSCSKRVSTDDTQIVQAKPKLAIVIVPFSDVLGTSPIAQSQKYVTQRYQNLPCSTSQQSKWDRAHQVLFQQIVIVKKENAHEVFIEIPHLLIQKAPHQKPFNLQGWMKKTDLLFLDELSQNALAFLPDIDHMLTQDTKRPTLCLRQPYTLKETKLTLSAATHLIIAKEFKTNYLCYVIDSTKKGFSVAIIPKSIALISPKNDRKKQLEIFHQLIKLWAHPKDGFIPYVLGGSSITTFQKSGFNKKTLKTKEKVTHVYDRTFKTPVKSGLDCSTLIYLAARCARLPYFAKNTTTAFYQLNRVNQATPVKKGDVIFIPGHVMVISSVEPLRIIQSRGYSSGVGHVTENLAQDFLYNIKTVNDLKNAFLKNKPLVYKNSKGKAGKSYKRWQLLQFEGSLP